MRPGSKKKKKKKGKPNAASWTIMTYPESWKLEPNNEDGFQSVVPRDVIQNKANGKGFQKVEESENDPICEPLYIVVRCW